MNEVAKSVVIATNDPDVKKQISSLLTQYAFSIVIEKSTIKSILKILEQEIDFIILDFDTLPNSSIDLISIVRKMRPRIPIVVLSSDNSLETVRAFTEVGVFYYAIKPIQIIEIEKVLEALMRRNHKSVI